MEKGFKSINSSKRIRRCRRPSNSESSEDEERLKSTLETAKELQKLRKRAKGISATELTLGKKVTEAEVLTSNDPFKLETGGLVNTKNLKSGKLIDSEGMAIGTAFSAETNCRDEDAEMMKYIEEELTKRKEAKVRLDEKLNKYAAADRDSTDPNSNPDWAKRPEDALYAVPEHLRVSSSKTSEEMLSNQMLSGIPEVDLGIEAKIRNIEATEDAKQRLLREKMNKKDTPSHFVPTNMAVNFVQHNRFNIEIEGPKFRKLKERKPVTIVGEVEGGANLRPDEKKVIKHKDEEEKATDDFHFEKFKKQFRRY